MNYFKHPTALIGEQAVIGAGSRVWAFVNIMDGAQIGSGCNICDHCYIEGKVEIGRNVTIKNNVPVYDGVVLEDNVFVGPNATFVNDRYPRSRCAQWKLERTVVGKGASIGANATIMCGVTIGEYAVIGAGCVVLKDVPAHTVVVGNPARAVGFVDQNGRPVSAEELA
ncbi:MAG: N-acetyltransferase [Candidatus Omnitrophica bacterium]|nr:N-acetyltransferase [Candidatus Omnitrophota bacterium]